MIFNGVDLGDYFRVNYERSLTRNIIIDTVMIPGRPGQVFKRARIDSESIPVTLRMRNRAYDDMASFRRFYSGLLMKTEPKRVEFKSDPGVYYEGLFQGQSILDNLWYTGKADASLFLPCPLGYALDTHTIEADGTRLAGSYYGTFEAWPTFTATPDSGEYFQLTDNLTGKYVRVNASFDGSQTVVVDTKKQQVTVNGYNTAVVFESDFFPLRADNAPFPTEFDITASHAGVKMTWREVYA